MVKAADINKDIKTIAEQCSTVVFDYDRVHNLSIENEFHYDYQYVIDEYANVKNITPEAAKEHLIERRILQPLPNGEYFVNVGQSTKGGGGINYWGDVLFTLTDNDFETKYHEIAHSLQPLYDLFNHDKIEDKYRQSEQELKEGEKADKKLIDKTNYKLYLNEMHSESFAYAALMLRASSTLDFIRQVSKAYHNAVNNNNTGFLSFGKTKYGGHNNNSKFYSTLPIMLATIKEMIKIRKEKRTADFFNEDGVLNAEKLAKLCENIVLEKAYSPRTLNAYFKYRIRDSHGKSEHGWRTDTAKSLVQILPSAVMSFLHEGNPLQNIYSVIKHDLMVSKEEIKIKNYLKKIQSTGNKELDALKAYEQAVVKRNQIMRHFPKEDIDTEILLKLPHIIQTGSIPPTICSYIAKKAIEKPIKRAIKIKRLIKEIKELNQIIDRNRDNPYFQELGRYDIDIVTLQKMIREKEKNPDKEVISESKLIGNSYSTQGYTDWMNTTCDLINNLASKYNLSDKTKDMLINELIFTPQKYNTRKAKYNLLGQCFNFTKINAKKELAQIIEIAATTHYIFSSCSDEYNTFLTELRSKSSSDIIATIKETERLSSMSNEEIISEKLSKLGLKRETYILLDLYNEDHKISKKENNVETTEGQYIEYFSDKIKKEEGKDIYVCEQNGYYGIYFDEYNKYLLTTNSEIAEKILQEIPTSVKSDAPVPLASGDERFTHDATQNRWKHTEDNTTYFAHLKFEQKYKTQVEKQLSEMGISPNSYMLLSNCEQKQVALIDTNNNPYNISVIPPNLEQLIQKHPGQNIFVNTDGENIGVYFANNRVYLLTQDRSIIKALNGKAVIDTEIPVTFGKNFKFIDNEQQAKWNSACGYIKIKQSIEKAIGTASKTHPKAKVELKSLSQVDMQKIKECISLTDKR